MVARTHPERLQHARGVVRQRVLGIAAGLTGVYLLLRKRALLGDAISHATLPGVAGNVSLYDSGWLAQVVTTLVAGSCHQWFARRLDRARAAPLAAYTRRCRLGNCIECFLRSRSRSHRYRSQIARGNAAGLESFIYGKAASMTLSDAWLSMGLAVSVLVVVGLFAKS